MISALFALLAASSPAHALSCAPYPILRLPCDGAVVPPAAEIVWGEALDRGQIERLVLSDDQGNEVARLPAEAVPHLPDDLPEGAYVLHLVGGDLLESVGPFQVLHQADPAPPQVLRVSMDAARLDPSWNCEPITLHEGDLQVQVTLQSDADGAWPWRYAVEAYHPDRPQQALARRDWFPHEGSPEVGFVGVNVVGTAADVGRICARGRWVGPTGESHPSEDLGCVDAPRSDVARGGCRHAATPTSWGLAALALGLLGARRRRRASDA